MLTRYMTNMTQTFIFIKIEVYAIVFTINIHVGYHINSLYSMLDVSA